MFGIRRPPPASRGSEHVRLVVTLLVCFEKTHCLVFGDRPMSACYDELGCLNLSGFYDPKVRFVNAVPWPRVKIRTHFKFYSRKNPQGADAFPWTVTADELRDSHFEPCLETKIFVHGYLQINKVPDTPMKAIRDALLALGDFNVILVDWSSGSKYEYVQATANTRIVGLEIARLIGLLQQAFGVTTDKFHILGHSLGSHIAGYAGQKLRNLGRITALDPAQPFFEGMSPLVRLDPSDAQFVDAIHTDGTRFVPPRPVGLGMIEPVGHIDFYPNGGVTQPGCERIIRNFSLKNGLTQGIRESVTCRHERAIQFMADALATEAMEDPGQCAFVAYACASYELFLSGACADCGVNGEKCAVMGLSSIASWRQQASELKMYLGTNDQTPFCLYHFNVVVNIVSLPAKVTGKLTLRLSGEEGEATFALSKREEEFSSDSNKTYLSTTATRLGNLLDGSLSMVSDGKDVTSQLVIHRVIAFLMNDVAMARYRKKKVTCLRPTSMDEARITLSRCDT